MWTSVQAEVCVFVAVKCQPSSGLLNFYDLQKCASRTATVPLSSPKNEKVSVFCAEQTPWFGNIPWGRVQDPKASLLDRSAMFAVEISATDFRAAMALALLMKEGK